MNDRERTQELVAREHVTSKIINQMYHLKHESNFSDRGKFNVVIDDCFDILVRIVEKLKEEK